MNPDPRALTTDENMLLSLLVIHAPDRAHAMKAKRVAQMLNLSEFRAGVKWSWRKVMDVAAELRKLGYRVAGFRSKPMGLCLAEADDEWEEYLGQSGRAITHQAQGVRDATRGSIQRFYRDRAPGQATLGLDEGLPAGAQGKLFWRT